MRREAAIVIRFVNESLEAYRTIKRNDNCILVAVFVGIRGDMDRHILFQDEKRDPDLKGMLDILYIISTVLIFFFVERILQFKSSERVDRVIFTLVLYNFFSALGRGKHDEDMINKIQAFTNHNECRILLYSYGLESLTGDPNKCPCTTSEAQPW